LPVKAWTSHVALDCVKTASDLNQPILMFLDGERASGP